MLTVSPLRLGATVILTLALLRWTLGGGETTVGALWNYYSASSPLGVSPSLPQAVSVDTQEVRTDLCNHGF